MPKVLKSPKKGSVASKKAAHASKAAAAKSSARNKVSRPVARSSSIKPPKVEPPKKVAPPEVEAPEVEAPPPVRKPLTKELLEVRERLKRMLTELRSEIQQEVKGASERDLAHIIESTDVASDAAEGDLALRIAESEGVEATEIQRAIDKVDNGSYGVCEGCNKPINSERLRFLPFATHCIKCQELAEIRRKDSGDELEDLSDGDEGGDDN